MTDYLSNLSARSFDLAGEIELARPRLPSLFEPSQETRGVSIAAPARSPMNSETYDDGQTPSLPMTSAEPMHAEQTLGKRYQASGAPAIDSDTCVQLYQRPTESFAGAEERTPAEEQSHVTVLPREETPKMATSIHSTAKPLELELLTKLGSVQEKEMKRPTQPLNRSDKERLAIENVILRKGVEQIVDREVFPGADVGEQHNVITPPRIQPLQHPIEPILRPWQNHGYREDTIKQEPTIHVTIGRIEVRAVTAPIQNRPRPKAPVSMSLDEYLRKRNGGER